MLADSGSESGSHKAGVGGVRGSGGHKSGGGSDGKPTRVRTVLNEKQLHTLRTCYAANPRPDALMKEQLVEMTGLSPRVIRVWFQNKRCKDKKKTIAMKQQMQEKVTSYDIAYISVLNYALKIKDCQLEIKNSNDQKRMD